MLESRKRSNSEERDDLVVKKRVLSSASGSPVPINGASEKTPTEPEDEKGLDDFRKGAIYRRMRHYSRAFERSQRRVVQLEQERIVNDTDLATLQLSLTKLYDTIDLLVKPEELDLSEDHPGDSHDLPNTLLPDSDEVVESLRKRMEITQKFVAAFVKLAGQNKPRPVEELVKRCQDAQSEVTTLRVELQLAHRRINDVEGQKSLYFDELIAAESRLDRLRSTDPRVNGDNSRNDPTVEENAVKKEVVEEKPVLEPPETLPTQTLGDEKQHDGLAEDLLFAKQQYDARVLALENEATSLREQISLLQIESVAASEDTISKTPYFMELKQQYGKIEQALVEVTKEKTRILDELNTLKDSRRSWEDGLHTATSKELEELTIALKKRDEENGRLRQQRDQQMAEISERKAKIASKYTQIEELRSLTELQAERISILHAEARRLKAHLAATHGDSDLLNFLSNGTESSSYTNELKEKLSEIEAKYVALNVTVNERDKDSVTEIFQEADLRQQLSDTQKKLLKYEALFGAYQTVPADAESIVQQLHKKQEELDAFKLKESIWEQSQSGLYAELDKLSSAWEHLESQLKTRVYDLAGMEDKLSKLGVEKAKAENKYFSAMREKEASAAERKALQRDLEKVIKHRDTLEKSERDLNLTLSNCDKSQRIQDDLIAELKAENEKLKREIPDNIVQREYDEKRVQELRQKLSHKEKVLTEKDRIISKLQDELQKIKQGYKTVSKKLQNALAGHDVNIKDKDMEDSLDKYKGLLTCSTCRNELRSTIILKCMHTFCKKCVDARISHRQRKCPYCNVQFGQGDVQTLYYQ